MRHWCAVLYCIQIFNQICFQFVKLEDCENYLKLSAPNSRLKILAQNTLIIFVRDL